MKNILILLVIISFQFALAEKKEDQCMNCHLITGGDNNNPAVSYKQDVHFSLGLTCASCHGGDDSSDDMDKAMDKQKGFKGVPTRSVRYQVCVKCHNNEGMQKYGSKIKTNQFEDLKSSVHFKNTFDNKGPIADCITCHGIHDIARVKNPASKVYPTKIVALCSGCHSSADYMKNYNPGLPIDQAAKYATSIHGIKNLKGDINTAQCASCHGSHDIKNIKDPQSKVYATNIPQLCSDCHSNKSLMDKYGLPSNQFTVYKNSVHGKALLEKGDLGSPSCNGCHGNHGAVPPGVESISKVCGTCHAMNADLFEKSPHKKAFEIKKLPECETCHGNHNIQHPEDNMIGISEGSVCISCHKAGDNGFIAADNMRKKLEHLKKEDSLSMIALHEADNKGMDVSDAEFAMKDIRQVLMRSRTSIHSMSDKDFDALINSGLEITTKSKNAGNEAVADYYFRRKGLAVSTIIVSVLVVGLYRKLKNIEKKQNK